MGCLCNLTLFISSCQIQVAVYAAVTLVDVNLSTTPLSSAWKLVRVHVLFCDGNISGLADAKILVEVLVEVSVCVTEVCM